jgi:hypothetical protein
MLSLRRYQEEALHELFVFWRNGGGNPLIAMATGTGKSVIIAFLVKQLLTNHPNMRVLITAPNRELIDQDVAELLAIWPGAPIGINCEGMGSRDTDAQILFALVNSIYRRPKDIGPRDLVIIDECFPAGTMIATPFGDRPIESLRPGDAVINATGIGFVEACRISQTTVLINLELTDGRIIRCTPNHPIFTDQGWCYAGKLAQGARVFSQQDLREPAQSFTHLDWQCGSISGKSSGSVRSPVRGRKRTRCGILLRWHEWRLLYGGLGTSRKSVEATGRGLHQHSMRF